LIEILGIVNTGQSTASIDDQLLFATEYTQWPGLLVMFGDQFPSFDPMVKLANFTAITNFCKKIKIRFTRFLRSFGSMRVSSGNRSFAFLNQPGRNNPGAGRIPVGKLADIIP
jgi:hypothetical protein